MRGKKSALGLLGSLSLLGWLSLLGCATFVRPAEAVLVINEFLADPAAGLAGDANNDGVRSASGDEFVEILNYGPQPVDLTGWSLADALATRHVFPQETTLSSYQYLVVFGGGAPQFNDVFWQLASTGALSLNNTNETIFLRDVNAYVIDQVHYGSEGNDDRSLVRYPPEGSLPAEGISLIFVEHNSLPQSAGAAFSPGTGVDGKPLVVGPVEPLSAAAVPVPELPTLVYGLLGALGFARKRMTHGSTGRVDKSSIMRYTFE
jgi:hypothetical protein